MKEILNLPGFTFHHVGIAVRNINKTAAFYESTGWKRVVDTFVDKCQNIKACFYSQEGFPLMELIEAVDEYSPMVKILEKSGVGPYHCCYGVDDIEKSVNELKKIKFMQISRLAPSAGMPGRRVCFIYGKDFGLIELVENRDKEADYKVLYNRL